MNAVRAWTGQTEHVLLTSTAGVAAGAGFVLGISSGELGEAFATAAAGAVAVAAVGCLVGGVRWLWNLDRRMAAMQASIQQGFDHAKTERDRMGLSLTEIGLRVAAVEGELAPNGGSNTRDAINRIDRRSRKVAEQVGAIDYDDEDAI